MLTRRELSVTYAAVNERATNLGCFRNAGLYRNPQPGAIVIHRIKGPAGLGYVWRECHPQESKPAATHPYTHHTV